MTSRTATTQWRGDLQSGTGHVELTSSGTASFDVTFPRRVGEPEGTTSPEELIAAAHSSCLAMNLTGVLGKNDLSARSVDVTAEVTVERVDGLTITGVVVTVRADVPGVDADRFAELAQLAERTCPVSKALAGTKITLDASLVSDRR
jgi:osmotically inducible protein OsmC